MHSIHILLWRNVFDCAHLHLAIDLAWSRWLRHWWRASIGHTLRRIPTLSSTSTLCHIDQSLLVYRRLCRGGTRHCCHAYTRLALATRLLLPTTPRLRSLLHVVARVRSISLGLGSNRSRQWDPTAHRQRQRRAHAKRKTRGRASRSSETWSIRRLVVARA